MKNVNLNPNQILSKMAQSQVDPREHVSVVICGHVDSGKCFHEDTEILMSDGRTKKVQDIKVGDFVMGDDSKPSKVKTLARGEDEMYDIIPVRGEKYTVTQDHVLVLKPTNYEMVWWDKTRIRYRIRWLQNFSIKEKSYAVCKYYSKEEAKEAAEKYLSEEAPKLEGYQKYGSPVEIKAKTYAELPKRVQDAYKGFSIGLNFNEQQVEIDPYMLGYWLGDGTSSSTSITTTDEEIVEYLHKFADKIGMQVTVGKEYHYDITSGTFLGPKDRNPWLNFLKKNKLIDNKHIPDNYKFNSKENRLKLLAGFIDSDGYETNNVFDFCQKSEKLTDDMIFLIRSLGFFTYKTPVRKTCTNGKNGPVTGDYFRFFVCGEGLEEIPVLLERKKAHARMSSKAPCVNGIKIEAVGKKNYYGFELENNPRFLLGDFTVTHNSSLCGRLLYEMGGINEREMQKLKEEADKLGKSSFCFAFYMDKQKEERERGITIVCTTKEFFTKTKHYTIIDAPGHRDFIKNMISGASQADVAVIMVPADGNFTVSLAKGNAKEGEVQGQTRQHARLVNLLGVKQIIVGVNKMDCDLAKYSEERFNEVKNEAINTLLRVGYNPKFVKENVVVLPISGWKGDNLMKKSDNMPWWKGTTVKALDGNDVTVTTLYEALEEYVKIPKRPIEAPLRVPVSTLVKIKGIGEIVCGRVEQGTMKVGDEVIFLPAHTDSIPCVGKVFSIEMHHRSVDAAGPGDNVGVSIKGLKDYSPKSGDIMILKKDQTLKKATRITAQVQVLEHPGELKVGYTPVGFVRTSRAPLKLVEIKWKMGKETGNQKVDNPACLKSNEMAEVVFEPQLPFVVETFDKCEGLGRLAIMDSSSVVMLGKVTQVLF